MILRIMLLRFQEKIQANIPLFKVGDLTTRFSDVSGFNWSVRMQGVEFFVRRPKIFRKHKINFHMKL